MSQYLFKAQTKEGFYVKILSELLSGVVKHPTFTLSPEGISLRATDQKQEILLDINLPKDGFNSYKCPKENIYFVLNSAHFYKLLKPIKKKDSVMLFIDKNRPMELGISVGQSDEGSNNRVTTFIVINFVQPEIIELVEEYNEPINVSSKDFQKLKTLHNIGNDMKVTVQQKLIKFYVNGKNLFSREISMGEIDDDEKEDVEEPYIRTYSTNSITQLTKCAGQGGNIQIYNHQELPMKIKMRAGNLGYLTVYIKSREIEQSEEENEVELES